MRHLFIIIGLILLVLATVAVFFLWPRESEQRVKVIRDGVELDCKKVDGQIIGCVSSSTTAPRL